MKKSSISYLSLVSLALAAVAFVMLFMPGAVSVFDSNVSYMVVDVALGYADAFNETFAGVILIIFLIAAMMVSLLAFLQWYADNGKAENGLLMLASFLFFAVGLLFFLIIFINASSAVITVQLGFGIIVGGMASIVASACSASILIRKAYNRYVYICSVVDRAKEFLDNLP